MSDKFRADASGYHHPTERERESAGEINEPRMHQGVTVKTGEVVGAGYFRFSAVAQKKLKVFLFWRIAVKTIKTRFFFAQVSRILAENEVLRTTIGAYSALQTGAGWSGKNARSDAAL